MAEWFLALTGTVIGLLVGGWLSRHQAATDMLRVRRGDAYVRLSELVVRERQNASVAGLALEKHPDLLAPELTSDEWFMVQAQVAAFGSKHVRQLFESLLDDRVRLRNTLGGFGDAARNPGSTPGDVNERLSAHDRFDAARRAVLDDCSKLLAAINDEMAGSPHRTTASPMWRGVPFGKR
jgi:hypothetical protein